jgi:hypothetical protein
MRRETFKLRVDGRIEMVGGAKDGVIAEPCPCGRPPAGDNYLVAWREGGYALCHEGCLRPKTSVEGS